MTATESSWKTAPFGEVSPLSYSASFDEQQFKRLQEGLVPKAMEDKWFVYYKEPHLFFHRSWTGKPVYRITLTPEGTGARATESCCSKVLGRAENAEPEYDEYHDQLLDFLVSNLLLGQAKSFPRPWSLKDPIQDFFQHCVSGTGYPETTLPPKP